MRLNNEIDTIIMIQNVKGILIDNHIFFCYDELQENIVYEVYKLHILF